MYVALAAVAPGDCEMGLSVVVYIAQNPTRLSVFHDRSERHGNIYVRSVLAVAVVTLAFAAVFGDVLSLIHKVYETALVTIAHEVYAAAVAAVSTVGTAVRHAFIPQKRDRAVAAVARFKE